MSLVELARELLAKAEAFMSKPNLSDNELFHLREEIRAGAKRIADNVDGPKQAMNAITRGVRILIVLWSIKLSVLVYNLHGVENLCRPKPSTLLARDGITVDRRTGWLDGIEWEGSSLAETIRFHHRDLSCQHVCQAHYCDFSHRLASSSNRRMVGGGTRKCRRSC